MNVSGNPTTTRSVHQHQPREQRAGGRRHRVLRQRHLHDK